MSDRHHLRAARHAVVLAGLFLLTFTSPSHAYVDPGSTSLIITAILGVFASIGYMARLYWARLKSLLARIKDGLTGGKNKQAGE